VVRRTAAGTNPGGPCLDCVAANTLVSADIAAEQERWPHFAPAATGVGFRTVYAFPLWLMNRAVGGLNLFHRARTELTSSQLQLGQALADLAVLGLTQERDQRRVERLAEQTLTALNDRVHISHAIGMIAGTLRISPDDATATLAAHGAATGRSLRDLAQAITDGTLQPHQLGKNPVND
jgi:hypothetical protein